MFPFKGGKVLGGDSCGGYLVWQDFPLPILGGSKMARTVGALSHVILSPTPFRTTTHKVSSKVLSIIPDNVRVDIWQNIQIEAQV